MTSRRQVIRLQRSIATSDLMPSPVLVDTYQGSRPTDPDTPACTYISTSRVETFLKKRESAMQASSTALSPECTISPSDPWADGRVQRDREPARQTDHCRARVHGLPPTALVCAASGCILIPCSGDRGRRLWRALRYWR